MWDKVLAVLSAGAGKLDNFATIIAPILIAIIKWIERYEKEINAVILRIEKDAKDGWTREEKFKYAEELFSIYLFPKLPFYLRIFGKKFLMRRFKKIVERVCSKSHALKEDSKDMEKDLHI